MGLSNVKLSAGEIHTKFQKWKEERIRHMRKKLRTAVIGLKGRGR